MELRIYPQGDGSLLLVALDKQTGKSGKTVSTGKKDDLRTKLGILLPKVDPAHTTPVPA